MPISLLNKHNVPQAKENIRLFSKILCAPCSHVIHQQDWTKAAFFMSLVHLTVVMQNKICSIHHLWVPSLALFVEFFVGPEWKLNQWHCIEVVFLECFLSQGFLFISPTLPSIAIMCVAKTATKIVNAVCHTWLSLPRLLWNDSSCLSFLLFIPAVSFSNAQDPTVWPQGMWFLLMQMFMCRVLIELMLLFGCSSSLWMEMPLEKSHMRERNSIWGIQGIAWSHWVMVDQCVCAKLPHSGTVQALCCSRSSLSMHLQCQSMRVFFLPINNCMACLEGMQAHSTNKLAAPDRVEMECLKHSWCAVESVTCVSFVLHCVARKMANRMVQKLSLISLCCLGNHTRISTAPLSRIIHPMAILLIDVNQSCGTSCNTKKRGRKNNKRCGWNQQHPQGFHNLKLFRLNEFARFFKEILFPNSSLNASSSVSLISLASCVSMLQPPTFSAKSGLLWWLEWWTKQCHEVTKFLRPKLWKAFVFCFFCDHSGSRPWFFHLQCASEVWHIERNWNPCVDQPKTSLCLLTWQSPRWHCPQTAGDVLPLVIAHVDTF